MKNKVTFISLIFWGLIVNSCKPQTSYIKYHLLSGDTVDIKYELFDSTGSLIRTFCKKDSLMHGLDLEFYSDGIKKCEGNWYKGKQLGWFRYYDEKGKLQALRQYILVSDTANWNNDAAYLNQVIRFNNNGDTVKTGGFFLKLYTSGDTVKNGQPFGFKVILVAPLFKEMQIILCDFDDKYTLLPNAVCDTFGVENYQRTFSPKEYNLGQNFIRGKVVNFENYIDSVGISRQHIATIYFKAKFYVKP